jgi:tetratricopeptide (TPR) repeat protein
MAGFDESTQTLMLTNNLALFYQNSGMVDKADISYRKLLKLVDTYLSENSGYVSTAYTNYATFLNEQGRRDDAIVALQKAYDVQIESGNPSDNNMLIIYGNLGVINQESGNHEMALEYLRRAYEIGLRMVGEVHEFMAMIHTYNGISMAHLGMMPKAQSEIEKGMSIRIQLGGEQKWSIANSEYAFAQLAILEKDHARAEAHLLRSLSLLKSIYATDHQLVTKSLDLLIEVLSNQNKWTDALSYASDHLVQLEAISTKNIQLLSKYRQIVSELGGK